MLFEFHVNDPGVPCLLRGQAAISV